MVIPTEKDTLHVYSCTQGVAHVQMEIADVLGMARNHVFVEVKRIGGGFGGKETAGVLLAVPTAIAAKM